MENPLAAMQKLDPKLLEHLKQTGKDSLAFSQD